MNSSKKDTTQLQFLRFAALFPIFLWHCLMSGFNSGPLEMMDKFHVGLNGVSFFFFLSGFISTYHSYDKEVKVTASGIFQYVLKRLKKVYPLYLVITLYSVMFYDLPIFIANGQYYEARYQAGLLARHILLIQSWIKVYPAEYFCFSEVGWYLSVMVFLYVMNIPLKALGMRIRRACTKEGSRLNESVVFAIILVVVYLMTVTYCWAVRDTDVEFWANTFPISRLGEYVFGMTLGFFLRSVKFDEIAERIPVPVYTIIEAATLLFWFWWGFSPMFPWAERIAHWFLSNLVLLTVFTPGRGWISALFRKDPFRYLGDISFEFYLIHSMVLKTFVKLTDKATLATHRGDLLSLYGCLILAVMISALVAHKPFRLPEKSGQGGT